MKKDSGVKIDGGANVKPSNKANVKLKNKLSKKVRERLLDLSENHFWSCILFFILLFMTLTLAIGMAQSVWFDEAYSITLAKKSVEELIHLTAIDVHPPVYYLFLHFWGGIFGFNELSLRVSSLIMMATAIILMAELLKKLFSKRFAVFATFLLCLSPMLIRYGFEIRMYAMATMLAVLATLVLVDLENEKTQRRRRILQLSYAILVAVGMLTLYYTIVIWLTHAAYLIWQTVKNKKSLIRQEFWLVYALAVLFFMPWMLVAIKQFTNGALAQISEPMTVNNLLGIFSFNLLYKPIWQLDQIFGLLILGFIVLFGVLLAKVLVKKQKNANYLIFLAAGPLVLEILICLIKPMYVERYLVYSAPFLIALIAYLVFETKSKLRYVSLAYLFGLVIFGIINLAQVGNFNFQRMQKPDIKEISEDLRESGKNKVAPILTDSPYEAIELSYYLNDELYFFAPYDTLAGGYAPLNKSKFQIKNTEELKKFSCVRYVYYDAKLEPQLLQSGFIKTKNEETSRALKYTEFCKK